MSGIQLTEVIDEDFDSGGAEGLLDQGFDLIPLAAGQAAADAGHVDGG